MLRTLFFRGKDGRLQRPAKTVRTRLSKRLLDTLIQLPSFDFLYYLIIDSSSFSLTSVLANVLFKNSTHIFSVHESSIQIMHAYCKRNILTKSLK